MTVRTAPAAAELLAAIPDDPALPQLARALDPPAMADLLPFGGAAGVQATYVRYKPATNCLVLYECRRAGEPVRWAYAKLFAVEPPSDERIAVALFPSDLKLQGLGHAMQPDHNNDLLERLTRPAERERFRPHWGKWEMVRYKPERRCVLAGIYQPEEDEAGPRKFYARFYAGEEGARASHWHRYLTKAPMTGVRVARRLRYSNTYRVLTMRELSGTPLRRLIERRDGALETAITATARALASWHRLPLPDSVPAAAETLAQAAEALAALLPRSAREISELTEAILSNRPSSISQAFLHGDFYFDQVLFVDDAPPGFLDLDNVSRGDAAGDVANFCAHLERLATSGTISATDAERWSASFVDAYESAGGPIPARALSWHRARALLRLAVQPFRACEPKWPRRVVELYRAAERAAAEARC